jgi:hypothetical protein
MLYTILRGRYLDRLRHVRCLDMLTARQIHKGTPQFARWVHPVICPRTQMLNAY